MLITVVVNGYTIKADYIYWPEERSTDQHEGEASHEEVIIEDAWNSQGRRLSRDEIKSSICEHEVLKHIQECILNG